MRSKKFLAAAALLMFLAAAPGAADDEAQGGLLTREPLTSTVLAVLKEGRPLVLADMLPEWPKLKPLTPAGREDYLLRRALVLAGQKREAKKDFAGQPVFVVRFILLTEVDEYGEFKWGGAPELALLELERAGFEALTIEDIAALEPGAVQALFKSVKIDQSCFSKIPE